MGDALRDPRGPRTEEDVHRVVEGGGHEAQGRCLLRQELPPGDRAGDVRGAGGGSGGAVGDDDDPGELRPQLIHNGTHFGPNVDPLAIVGVPIDGEEYLRLDLPEAVEDPCGAKVGRAGGPDGPQAGGRQHRSHCVDPIADTASHAVSLLHPAGGQCSRQLRNSGPQLTVRHVDGHVILPPGLQRNFGVWYTGTQHVLGKVKLCANEPFCVLHVGVRLQDGAGLLVEADASKLRHGHPERFWVVDRPFVQCWVVRCAFGLVLDIPHVGSQSTGGSGLDRWLP
mmetsp:Transcript_37719/g.67357  ORF Transcript_37719/g.67357 Transcript_37719/m.67357 type:complete len:282 (-) Transcript_37719:98-943(-)